MSVKGSSLSNNVVMLYILKGSTYLFAFATIPYLTRVLGVETYGLIGFAMAFSVYIQLFLDFGFLLSSTAEVAGCDGDCAEISRIFSATSGAKILLIFISLPVVLVLAFFVDPFCQDPLLYVLYFAYMSIETLSPDYVYRGIERMSMITIRTVVIKAVFLVCVFVFIHNKSQYYLVPALNAVGSLTALCVVLWHMRNRLGIWFVGVPFERVVKTLKHSSQFFVSRIASTFYSSLNTMVLGFVMPGSATLGHFTACNNIVNAGKGCCSPVADSLFPYMVRTKNYRLLCKIALLGEVVVLAFCIPVCVWSQDICAFVFGAEYWQAGTLLSVLVFLVPVTYLSYLFGFPALTPMGETGFANWSVVLGAAMQVVLLLGVCFVGELSAFSICVITLITECFVALSRICVFVRGLHSGR